VNRHDPDYLYRIADRVAGRVHPPPTLDREDVVQDAVVAAIELLDSGWQPPPNYPADLALILAVRFKLGGRDAYYAEWQWAKRRALATDEVPAPAAPVSGSVEQLLEELLDVLPPHLRPCARLLLTGTPTRQMHKALATTQRRARQLVTQVRTLLQSYGLWSDDLYYASLGPGERWHRSDTTRPK